jgi:hypothetical protein
MKKWLTSIEGEHVAFTGTAWRKRSELQDEVRRQRGVPTSKGEVTGTTTILVRGRWAPGEFGVKERHAAELIRDGHVIAIVSDLEFRKLLEGGRRAKAMDRVAGQPIEWLEKPSRRGFEQAAKISGPLDYEHSALGRVEQSFLSRILFESSDEAVCALCGRKLPTKLMVAAHIKPRSECSGRERRDAQNIVFGVCLLGCDAFYERGLLSVAEDGTICIAELSESRVVQKRLSWYRAKRCLGWKQSNAKYFSWHLARRFQG